MNGLATLRASGSRLAPRSLAVQSSFPLCVFGCRAYPMFMPSHTGVRTRARPASVPRPRRPRPWTRADLARLPDDGNRYEVLDGELLVTPQANPPHQRWAALLLVQF